METGYLATRHRRRPPSLIRKVLALIGFAVALAMPGVDGTASADEPFIIGVEDNRYLPHYSFENGEYLGFGRDLLEAFFDAKGYAYEFRALPVARLFRSFLAREVDFKYPDSAYWSADDKEGHPIVYSDPVVSSTDGVSVPPDRVGRAVDDVKLLGTVRGFTTHSWMDRVRAKQVILSENDSTARLAQQAIMGRVDGAFANVDVIRHILTNVLEKPDALVFDTTLPHASYYYHFSSILHPEVIGEFNRWMKSEAELLDSIRRKHSLDLDID